MSGRVYNRFRILLAEKETRESRSIPYRTITQETGIAASTLVRWSNNQIENYNREIIAALCDYFGCEVGDLIVYDRENKSPK